MSKKKKEKQPKIEKICKNCKLFDPKNCVCHVVLIHEGRRVKIPVDGHDSCFYEGEYFDPTTKTMENFADEIQEVRFWVEDDKGQKTDKDGTVKIQYPEGFFGESLSELLGI